MITIKLGGLYVTKCGCIMKAYSMEPQGWSHLESIRECPARSHLSVITSRVGQQWAYHTAGGEFGGEEGTEFPLHLAKEIEP